VSARPSLFTISRGLPFVDTLAEGIIARVGEDPLDLAGVTVLLPTRRACRALQDAFLRRSGGRPTLLPRMVPLGDLDEDELAMGAGDLPGVAAALDLPPAIPTLDRQLLLTRFLLARNDGLIATTAQAARLAADLGRFLDEVWTERTSFDRLAALVPDELAEHWRATLEFLTILTAVWPDVLAERGAIDPADRRDRVLSAQAAAWRERPPAGPVIAAGDTGSIPAAADVLEVVAGLPRGAVVLPGLDLDADSVEWAAIGSDETHPQHRLAAFLERLGVERSEVRPWVDRPDPRGTRARLIAEALRPAATTETWRTLPPADPRVLDGLFRVDATTAEEEAAVVALLMRAELENPERRAALVTPDRALARRVTSALRRWGIVVDDSAGRAIGDTAVGTFLRLTADFAVKRVHPMAFLALVKHPMSAGGYPAEEFRTLVRQMERAVLRGPRTADGFAGLRAALEAAEEGRFTHPAQRGELREWLGRLEVIATPFLSLFAAGEAPLGTLIEEHARFAEAMAGDGRVPGPARLWARDDGVEAARFLDALARAAHGFPSVPTREYFDLFNALMGARPVRPAHGLHPRLTILGPLEARLQHFDLMILGGLNEGTWPGSPAADPWMSRPMRRDFGLPGPEQAIGLAAHDFASALGAERVVLTRALKVDGTPTVPSRWLSRLDTVIRAVGLEGELTKPGLPWLQYARMIDRPDEVRPVRPPAPTPPVEIRPRKLSVTEIETWMRDPYAIYAKHILRLRALEDLAVDPDAADRGEIIHGALEALIKTYPRDLPPDAEALLLELGRERFGTLFEERPDVASFWWPRFERIARWFVDWERARRPLIKPLATEVRGRIVLDMPRAPFILTAKADRIDRGPDGLVVVDYKTGEPPGDETVRLGLAPQLPLEALIVREGGFEGIDAGVVAELVFLRLSGGEPPGKEKCLKNDPGELADRAREGLLNLIRAYDDPATPYPSRPRPAHAPKYSDYEHLARVREWATVEVGGE